MGITFISLLSGICPESIVSLDSLQLHMQLTALHKWN